MPFGTASVGVETRGPVHVLLMMQALLQVETDQQHLVPGTRVQKTH